MSYHLQRALLSVIVVTLAGCSSQVAGLDFNLSADTDCSQQHGANWSTACLGEDDHAAKALEQHSQQHQLSPTQAAIAGGMEALGRGLKRPPRKTKKNPYGARYSIHGGGATEEVGLPQRGLAQGSSARAHPSEAGGEKRSRKARRKSKSRKARLSDKESMENNPETLSLLPSRNEKGLEAQQPVLLALPETKARPRLRNHAAELDSGAVQEHIESDSIERHEAASHANATVAVSGEGQLGIGGREAAGGVDSSGVQEHFDQDPSLLQGLRSANNTPLDASGAHMPKQPRAAGVDSAGVSEHILEDVGEDLLDTSGSTQQLAQQQRQPKDAEEREVAEGIGKGTRDGAAFDQEAIEEVADAAAAEAEEVGDVELASVGLMPQSWAATPGRGGRASETLDDPFVSLEEDDVILDDVSELTDGVDDEVDDEAASSSQLIL